MKLKTRLNYDSCHISYFKTTLERKQWERTNIIILETKQSQNDKKDMPIYGLEMPINNLLSKKLCIFTNYKIIILS